MKLLLENRFAKDITFIICFLPFMCWPIRDESKILEIDKFFHLTKVTTVFWGDENFVWQQMCPTLFCPVRYISNWITSKILQKTGEIFNEFFINIAPNLDINTYNVNEVPHLNRIPFHQLSKSTGFIQMLRWFKKFPIWIR